MDIVCEGGISPQKANQCGWSLTVLKTLLNNWVEELAKEVEPFLFLDFTITVGIEACEELVDLSFFSGLVSRVGKTHARRGELLNLVSVDLTVTVDVELRESFLSSSESLLSSLGNLLLIAGTESIHFAVVWLLNYNFARVKLT